MNRAGAALFNVAHDPAIGIFQHIKVDAVVGGIGSPERIDTRGLEALAILTSHTHGNYRIGNAMADKHLQIAHLLNTPKRFLCARQGAIHG